MPNLMINSYCNLQCPYCFADNEITECDTKNISNDNFQKIIEWYKKNKMRSIRIIGGEPTLHPNFGQILVQLMNDDFFEHVHIFSNMTFSKEIRELIIMFKEVKNISILPNHNFSETTKTKKELIEENIIELSKFNVIDTLGINIFDVNQDFSEHFNLIKKTNIKNIRYSITVPNKKLDENFNVKKYFNQFYNKLIELFDFCIENKLHNHIDCNSIPVCSFTDEQIKELVMRNPNIFSKRTECNPVIDINPKLELITCFGLSEQKIDYEDSLNIANNKLEEKMLDFKKKTLFKECKTCTIYKLNNNNSCACLSYRKDK